MVPYKQIWEAIAEDIKENIINGRYKPGERFKETELAARYAVSKTPVREALRHLERVGFVEIVPNTKVVVKKVDKKEVENLYKIQSVLEGLAAWEAIPSLNNNHYKALEKYAALIEKHHREKNISEYEKANFNFHAVIWKSSNNENLIGLLRTIHEQIQRFRSVTRRYPEKFKDLLGEHQKILKIIIAKDRKRSEELVRRHIEKHGKYIVDLLEKEDRTVKEGGRV